MKKGLIGLVGAAVLGLSSCTNQYQIDDVDVVELPISYYDLAEERREGKISYAFDSNNNLKRVCYLGKNYSHEDTIIFPAAEERVKYLLEKIDSINDSRLQEKLNSERKVAEDILNRKE